MSSRTDAIIRADSNRAAPSLYAPRLSVGRSEPEDVLAILWARRRTVAIAVAGGLVMAVLYLLVAPPVYTAVARLQVSPGLPQLELGGGPQDAVARAKNYLNTQCQLIASAAVLDRIAANPDVQRMRTFAGADDLLSALKSRLAAMPGSKDDLITVSLESGDEAEAARVVNLVVESYVQHEQARTRGLADEMLKLLTREKEQQIAELNKHRQKMLAHKKDHAALSFVDERSNITLQRLAQLSDAMTAAEVEKMRASASYDAAKAITRERSEVGDLVVMNVMTSTLSSGEVANNRAFGEMREELLKAEVQLGNAKRQLGANHPGLANLQHAVNEIRGRLASLSMEILRQSSVMAAAKADLIAQAFKEQKAQALELNTVTAEFAVLEGDVTRAQRVVDQLEARITELRMAGNAGGLVVTVAEPARVTGKPTGPRKSLALAGGALAGLVLGACFVFAGNLRDARLHSGDDIGATLQLPVLCGVPHMPGRGWHGTRRRALIAATDPSSHVAESYRMIRTALQLGTHRNAKTLLITSPDKGEGKSTVACNLAIVLAQAGERTLLVDADLRRPTVHEVFGLDATRGITSVLLGESRLGEAIQKTKYSRLDVLGCGPIPGNPSELLNTASFTQIIERLSLHYTRIVFDTPPARLADPLILAASCDATLLVLRAGRSTRATTAAAYGALRGVGARFLGAVANDVRSEVANYTDWHASGAPAGADAAQGRELFDDAVRAGAEPYEAAAAAAVATAAKTAALGHAAGGPGNGSANGAAAPTDLSDPKANHEPVHSPPSG